MEGEDRVKILKDRKKLANQKYYEANKQKLLLKSCEKVECEKCGATVARCYMTEHKKNTICKRISDFVNKNK